MSLPLRLALLVWAQQQQAAVVEDDYDSEFRYGGRPIEPLQTLDTSGRVIYVGSFSKTLLATLRLGNAVRTAKFLTDWHTALPPQAALARFIEQGFFARHLRRMRAVCQARQQRIVAALRHRFARHLEVVPSVAGLHLAAIARTASSEELEAVLRRASAAGVELLPLSMYGVDTPPLPGSSWATAPSPPTASTRGWTGSADASRTRLSCPGAHLDPPPQPGRPCAPSRWPSRPCRGW